MRAALIAAAERFSLRLAGRPVFGWKDRTIAAEAASDEGTAVWLRVASQLSTWAFGEFWEGNKDAGVISGVDKPDIIDVHDWSDADRWFRAEIMTYVDQPVISDTPDIRSNPGLPDAWWSSLQASLDRLGVCHTERVHINQLAVTRRLRQYFADHADPTVDFWVTSHNDLHWSNLTRPGLYILDWEGWGMAPFGYDPATLYCHSLLVPDLASEVHDRFAEELDTADGVRSQLLVIARMLSRSGHGDYPDLVLPLHKLADKLTGR